MTTPANSTNDPRVIWEDGTWAIIEAKHYPPGIGRSKSRDQLQDAVNATWEPTLITAPGTKSIATGQLVKVRLQDFWAMSPVGSTPGVAKIQGKGMLNPADYKAPVAPPSPFMPKPWKGKDIPEYPSVCPACGGRMVILATSSVHEATDPKLGKGDGRCPPVPVKAGAGLLGNLPPIRRQRP